jgi:hypothetical protein
MLGFPLAGPSTAPVPEGSLRDTPRKIRFILPPAPLDFRSGPILLIPPDDSANRAKTLATAPVAPLQLPAAPKFSASLLPAPPDLAVPSLSLAYPFYPYSLNPAESISVERKAVRDFPEYWADLEAREGVDELRRQLGMPTAAGARTGIGPVPGLTAMNGSIGVDFISLGSAFRQAWNQMNLEKDRQQLFQAKVSGLIGYAQDLGARKNSGPAISLIVARLDFMKKKAAGKLPIRPERLLFTEPLKAWAVNPVFDSTRLGATLLDVCRMYEEMTN